MEDQKNKCFIYHRNGVIQDIIDGSFCDDIARQKIEILRGLQNGEKNTITYNGQQHNVTDFWFTDITLPVGYKTEYHITIA